MKDAPVCMDPARLELIKGKLEQAVDSIYASNREPAPRESVFVEDICRKRRYHRGSYEIVLFREAEDPAKIAGSTKVIGAGGDRMQCFERALGEIEALKIESAAETLSAYKAKFPIHWGDGDIGPAKWLACGGANSAEWADSIATMLHELMHDLRSEKDCLFQAGSASGLCFDFPADLPERGIAKLDRFPLKEPRALAAVKAVQDLYFDALNASFALLLDEILGYGVTVQALTKQLRVNGKAVIFPDPANSKARSYVVLPQMMYYGVRYLELLRKDHGRLYDQVVSRKGNVENMGRLFADAEAKYRDWLGALADTGGKAKDPEEKFWNLYLSGKARLKLF